MGARYYDGGVGRFTAQDPVSLSLGDWKEIQEDASVPLNEWIRNPQRLNTYAYAGNNPIKNIDKDGKDYYEVGGDGTLFGYSVTFSVKYDHKQGRLDGAVGGGYAAGASATLTFSHSQNDLPNERTYILHDGYISGGYYIGAKLGVENQPFKDGSFSDINLSSGASIGVGTGVGISGGVQATYNKTLIDLSLVLSRLRNILNKRSDVSNQNAQESDSNNNDDEKIKL